MRLVPALILGLAAFFFAAAASAGEGCGGQSAAVQHIFDAADTDGGGTLTAAEYSDAGLQNFGVSFEETDANGDGEMTLGEYLALYPRHHSGGEQVGS